MSFFILLTAFTLITVCIGNISNDTDTQTALTSYSGDQLFSLQREKINCSEPIITYRKLKEQILELLGSQFSTERKVKLDFVTYLSRHFPIHSLVFKDFKQSPPLHNILPNFIWKLNLPIKAVTFDNCIISSHPSLNDFRIFKNVEYLKFTHCATTQNDFNEFLSLFLSKLILLTIDEVVCWEASENHLQFSNAEAQKEEDIQLISFRLLALSKFPNLQHFWISGKYDFHGFKFNQFQRLKVLSIEHPSYFPVPIAALTDLPSTLKCIRSNCPEEYIEFIDELKLVEKGICIEHSYSDMIEFGLLKSMVPLFVITSLYLVFDEMSEEMSAEFFNFLTNNRVKLGHITKIGIRTDLSSKRWNQLLQIIESLQGLKSLSLSLENYPEQSIQLPISNRLVTAINDLEIGFASLKNQSENEQEMSSVVCYLLSMMPGLKYLDFHYRGANTFISHLLQCNSLPSIQLVKYSVTYLSNDPVSIQNDLEISRKFRVKELIMRSHLTPPNFIETVNDLNTMQDLSIEKLTLSLPHLSNYSIEIIRKLIEKAVNVKELEILPASQDLITETNLLKLQLLRTISIKKQCTFEEVKKLFEILSLQIQKVHISLDFCLKEDVMKIFRKKFPNAVLFLGKPTKSELQ